MQYSERYSARMVPERAIQDKLAECVAHGVDIDKIPLSVRVDEILRMTIIQIRTLTLTGDGSASSHLS